MTILPADSFQGRVTVITGGSSGLGLAMASYFGQLGASLVIDGGSWLGRNIFTAE